MDNIAIIINALGWTLIHFLWQGMLVASLMWLLLKLIPQQRSQWRYLGSLGLYFLLLPVSINTFIFFFKSAAAPAVLALDLPMVSVAAGVKPGMDFWLNEGIEPLLPLVVLLWALGVSLLAIRTLIGWAGTRLLVRKNVESISAGLQRRVDGLIGRLHVRQAVSVLVSSKVKVPTVIGWIKPVILLPASVLARLPVQQLEMIIAHELGHIHRYDYLVNLLQVLIDTLFFYHPQVRWMSRSIRQEREHCCDDFVLNHECKPSVYARALANLEILRQPSHATALAATGGDLLHRVHRIANSESPGKSAGFAQFAMMTVLVAVAGMGARSGLEMGAYSEEGPVSDMVVSEQFSFSASDAGPVGWISEPDPYEQIRQGIESNRNKDKELARVQDMAAAVRRSQPVNEQTLAQIETTKVQPDERLAPPEIQLAILDTHVNDLLRESGPVLESVTTSFDLLDPQSQAIQESGQKNQNTQKRATVKPVKTVNPRYPTYARSRAVEGWVKLSFTVDKGGRAKDIKVVAASPLQIFDRAAKKALQKWQFETFQGHDADSQLAQTFEFSMHPSDVRSSSRKRRCNLTGSNICGAAFRQENVEIYGAKNIRMEASYRNKTSQQTHRHTNSK